MKRPHGALETRRWRVDTSTRLALLIPMDNVRRIVQPGMRSVYYCPPDPSTSGSTGMVIDGLLFELYALVGETLTDEELFTSFLYSYLSSEMIDRESNRFPDTPYGTALVLAKARQDPGLLNIDTVPSGTMDPVHYMPYIAAKTATRLVRVTTRSHAIFVYLIERYGRDDSLTRHRDDPSRAKTHALLLLCMNKGAARRLAKGGAVVAPPHRIQTVASLRQVSGYSSLELLLGQLRLSIDDFVRLTEYERQLVQKRLAERARRMQREDYEVVADDGIKPETARDPSDLSAFTPGTSQLYASASANAIDDCSGTLFPGKFRLPRELEGPLNLPHLHTALGAKPWLLDEPVPFGCIHQVVHYDSLTFHRTMSGRSSTLDGPNAIRFKTHDDLMNEYVPPPPAPPKPASKPKAKPNQTGSQKKKTPSATRVPSKKTPPVPTTTLISMTQRATSKIDMAMVRAMTDITLKPVKIEKQSNITGSSCFI